MKQMTLLDLVRQGCPRCEMKNTLCLSGKKEFKIAIDYNLRGDKIEWGDADDPTYLGHLWVTCDHCGELEAIVTTKHGNPEETFLVSF